MRLAIRSPLQGMLVAVLFASMLATTSLAHSATRLRIAGQHPVDNIATQVLQEAIKEIENSNVDIKIKLFPAGQLGTGEQVFGDVAKGLIDIGHTFIYSHNDPLLEINSMPYLVENYEQMRKVYSPGSNFYRVYEDRLDKQGLKLLGVFAEGFIGVGTKKKPDNVTTTGPKNTNIRIMSAEVAKLTATAMGFASTTINWGDTVPAVQQGVVDGAMGGTAESNLTVLGDSIHYFIPYNVFVENTAFYISTKVWNKLNEQQQQVVAKAFSTASARSFDLSEKTDHEYIGKLKAANIEVVDLSLPELQAIASHVRTEVWPALEGKFGRELIEQLKQDAQ